jgi:hypothetical protein
MIVNPVENIGLVKDDMSKDHSKDNRIILKSIYAKGIKCGYPKCCINAFIVLCANNPDLLFCEDVCDYIPCDKHMVSTFEKGGAKLKYTFTPLDIYKQNKN